MNAPDPAPDSSAHSPSEPLAALERSFAALSEPGAPAENAAQHIGNQIESLRRESTLNRNQLLNLLREIAGQCTAAMDQLENRARELSQEAETETEDAGSRRQLLSRVEALRKEIYRQLRSLQQSEEQGVPGKLAMALETLYRRNQQKLPPMSPN